MSAYALARHFRPTPIYEALIEQDGIHLPHRRKGLGHVLDQMRVEDAVQRKAVTIAADLTIAEAVDLIRHFEFTTFPVVDNDRHCIGSVTEMRLRRTLVNKNGDALVRDIADPCQIIFLDQALSEAVLKMNDARVRQLTVADRESEQRIVGIITMSDIVRVQASALAGEESSRN
jgi:CIC family chloride channel protein